jgi:superfamily II DNA or RNA helicase
MNPLRKNQEDAMHYFKKHYYENKETRGILSMCCGSGKTRTFYEIMKYCFEQNEKLCIYATSRILLVENVIQEILEYLYLESIIPQKIHFKVEDICIMVKVSNFNILRIIKELTKKLSNIEKFNKAHFKNFCNNFDETNTKKNNCISFVDASSRKHFECIINCELQKNKKFIFVTTYESLVKIYDTISTTPDLIVCDESHHLVSDNNKLTNKVIDPTINITTIHANKYLFMTATPLTILQSTNITTKIYSMENEEIFGKCFYEYTFYDGIKDKCIVNFDVLCYDKLIVSNNTPTSNFEKQTMYFNVVIEQLLTTIKEFNLKRTIVYVSNQTKAEQLKKIGETALNSNYNNVQMRCVISEQSHIIKIDNIEWFKKPDYIGSKILISVNIFDEGIDIPMCDSVLFAEARHSETQIVQNIGRALRLHHTKQIAYVIIPVYFEEINNENNDRSNNFNEIFNICEKLRRPTGNTYKRKYIGSVNERTEKNANNCSQSNKEYFKQEEYYNNEYRPNIQGISITKVHLNSQHDLYDNNIIFQDNNEDYNKYKKHIQQKGLIHLYELKLFIAETKTIQQSPPHEIFKESFISYGDLLHNETNTYDESVEYLQNDTRLRNYIDNIKSSYDWEKYHTNLLTTLFNNMHQDINECVLSKFLKLPVFPKKYYSNVWKNWSKYLTIELEENAGVPKHKHKPSYTSRVNENFNQLPKYYSAPIRSENILPVVSYIKKYYELNNLEFTGMAKFNINNKCNYFNLYFKNKHIFTINNTGKIIYTPHNFTETTFTPTSTQLNKNRNFDIKGIDIIDIFNNLI